MKTSKVSTEVEQRQRPEVLNGNVQDLLLAALP